ncbi:M61 family metallopeptidase [Cellulophaga tyrosinoxydans]|uniref:Predicted metalloprotease, contains C-terminal PDZ domain n=1 Tax=Cellulophaga tyrosinoxydans TaxID=504486 RepID=A0A1W1Z6A7_9FLAO|nr:PDZ domain-containing protein [Cellulophaga tyrosinoxydans]SMC43468.1 Predicted metalloprotease, contains C-terminal PDZ domain [Cellulophaga tyrosinoxydans]
MKSIAQIILLFLTLQYTLAQTNTYSISFENAIHHEAVISATFPEVTTEIFTVQMSRSSPGRYALHEFAKNIYNFKATDSEGNNLVVTRPNPYQWNISGHDGTVTISYTLFADRGDGTYSQIDETHAHLNIPATFMFSPEFSDRKIEVNFRLREDLNWKIATQMPLSNGTTYTAPNLQYFMDSPTELSNFGIREFEVLEKDGRKKNIQFVLHHNGTEEELNTYFEKVKSIVLEEQKVYGELPDFDYNTYTFLACYIPNASGDGMEHRNSTILTSIRSLANGGMKNNLGTVSHEFFHSWNVERIRPKTLEPFNFEEANMSGELWFAEGFTSYYTNLILCRAKLISAEEYVEDLSGTFNYVWNSPARQFFNPIEMSYQAPFVDAATSVDPVNRENTFISYYSYGSILGLALDLSLREKGLNLDDYMKLVWNSFGKKEIPYTIENLKVSLNAYAGKEFGEHFFDKYIYKSQMPDYKSLFATVGVDLIQDDTTPYFGAAIATNDDLFGEIQRNTAIGSPAYIAGLDKGDVITAINNQPFPNGVSFQDFLKKFHIGDELKIDFLRFETIKSTKVRLTTSPNYRTELVEKNGEKPVKKVLNNRKAWLKIE